MHLRNPQAAKAGNSYNLSFEYNLTPDGSGTWTLVEMSLPSDLNLIPADELGTTLLDTMMILAQAMGHDI